MMDYYLGVLNFHRLFSNSTGLSITSSRFSPFVDLNNPYIHIEQEIIGVLAEQDNAIDNEPIEEVDNVQIDDVVVDRV